MRSAVPEVLVANVGDVTSRRRRNNAVKRHSRRRRLMLSGRTELGCAMLKFW